MLLVAPHFAEAINRFIAERGGGRCWPESFIAIGWASAGRLTSGACAYDLVPGRNCMMNIAIEPGTYSRAIIRAALNYGFLQLRLPRLTFIIEQDNLASISLVERLGARLESRLHEAGKTGDLLIFSLFRETLFWRKLNGQERRSPRRTGLREADSATECGEPKSVQLPACV